MSRSREPAAARRASEPSESSPLVGANGGSSRSTTTGKQSHTNHSNNNNNNSTTAGERSPLIASAAVGAAATESLVQASVGGDLAQAGGVSWRMAAFLLVNTALGAGMLNYPYAYNQIGGVWAAGLMQVALLSFITSTMFILVYCADLNRDDTYHDVLLSMCGKRAQQLSATSILLTCYGINITFLVIIGDQYDRIFQSLMTPAQLETYWFLGRKFTIFATSILFIWPMCYARRLDFLRHASVLGMFAMLYVAFLTIYEHYTLDETMIQLVTSSLEAASLPQHGLMASTTTTTTTTTPAVPMSSSSMFNQTTQAPGVQAPGAHLAWLEPLAIVPVLCFAYQTHEVIVPVYACMKERFIGNFMKATIFGLVILFFLYNLVGAFGYLTFGERVGADIMSLYDAKDPVVVVGIVALVVKFITTYPPLMFCGRSALDGLYGELRQMSASEFKSREPRRRYVISTAWFASSVAIAVFAPDISVTLQLLGSMASINVFVFPGMCLWSLTRRLRRARLALLMGELPEGCAAAAGAGAAAAAGGGMAPALAQQRAKDYHLISGSYFGAAMKKNQQQQLAACATQANACNAHNCCNPHCATAAAAAVGSAETRAPAAAQQSALADQTSPKQFTATFASLIELESNLGPTAVGTAVSTVATLASNGGPGSAGAKNGSPLLQFNGGCGGGALANGSSGLLTASFSTPSSASSSSAASSTGEQPLLNGFGSGPSASNDTGAEAAAAATAAAQNVLRRQDGFERLMLASGTSSFSCSSCCCTCACTAATGGNSRALMTASMNGGASSGNSFAAAANQQQQLKLRHAPNQPTTSGHRQHQHLGRSINDSYDDYSDYNYHDHDQYQEQDHLMSQARQANTNYRQHLHQQCNHHQHHQQNHHNHRMTIDESHHYQQHQYATADQALDRSCQQHAAGVCPCKNTLLLSSSLSTRHQQQHFQRSQCMLHTSSMNNYCQQSTTGSLLDKFGASIAPSTVAQIGISRCTAAALYTYAGLLVVFGIFIFVLELVTVSGLL